MLASTKQLGGIDDDLEKLQRTVSRLLANALVCVKAFAVSANGQW